MKTIYILIHHYTVDPRVADFDGQTDYYIEGVWSDRCKFVEYLKSLDISNDNNYEILEMEDGTPKGCCREYIIKTFPFSGTEQ